MNRRLKHSRYITGFDGIRTLAVIGVICYHILPATMPGGFLGVPIFFVVSGYLITDLLLQEWDEYGKIDVKAFYLRRIRRLYPALVTMVLTTAAYITVFQRNLLTNLKGIVISNFLYVYNWFQIAHHESYFDKFGGESPFTHLWSLSIEGQFYFLWPLLVILALTFIKKRVKIFDILFVLAGVSALAMAFIYHDGIDPSRLYYGTDTRTFSILLGASLAFIWPSTALKRQLDRRLSLMVDVVGLISLAIILTCFFKMDSQSATIYRGGMFLFSLVAMIFIATVAHPGADMNRLFTNKVFTWLGKRSYGIYLYQYPVMIFYESKIAVGNHPLIHALIEILLIVVISALSYRYIERPLQRYNYRRLGVDLKGLLRKQSQEKWLLVVPVIVIVTAVVGMFLPARDPGSEQSKQLQETIAKNTKQAAQKNKRIGTTKKATKDSKNTNEAATSQSSKDFQLTTGLTKQQLAKAQTLQITAVGDSVLADTSAKLTEIFPQMYVDGKVGRQVYDTIPVLKSLAANGKLANVVLLVEGTNGSFNDNQLAEIMAILGDRQVYWVNVYVPTKSWQNTVNNALTKATKKYHNLTIIDWYNYSRNHSEWFYNDQVHPNVKGQPYYANYVARKILK